MTIISSSQQVHETGSGRTRVRYSAGSGFSLVTQLKSGGQQSLPIDPAAMDELAAVWREWSAPLRSDARAQNAEQVTRSPYGGRDGPERSSSRSSPPESPRSTTRSGSGEHISPNGRDAPAGSSPSGPKTLL